MKEAIFFLSFLVLTSCEPTNYIYIRNHSEKPLKIIASFETDLKHGWNIDSLKIHHQVYKKLFWWSVNNFNDNIEVDYKNKYSYEFVLDSNTTCLLEPFMLYFAKEVEIREDGKINTIIFYGKNSNLHENKKKYSIQKRGFYNKTIIINIKESF
jgi:hypothetical protein